MEIFVCLPEYGLMGSPYFYRSGRLRLHPLLKIHVPIHYQAIFRQLHENFNFLFSKCCAIVLIVPINSVFMFEVVVLSQSPVWPIIPLAFKTLISLPLTWGCNFNRTIDDIHVIVFLCLTILHRPLPTAINSVVRRKLKFTSLLILHRYVAAFF